MRRLAALLLVLSVCTGCEAYVDPTYPGAGDAPANDGDVATAVAAPKPRPPSSEAPAPAAQPASAPVDPVATWKGGADAGKPSDDQAALEPAARSAASIRVEIRQLESLLHVLRRTSPARPKFVQQLAADYDDLSRVGATDEERANAASQARQVLATAAQSDGSR